MARYWTGTVVGEGSVKGWIRSASGQDDLEGAIYFSSWRGGLTKWVSELSLIVGQPPLEDLPTLDEHLQTP